MQAHVYADVHTTLTPNCPSSSVTGPRVTPTSHTPSRTFPAPAPSVNLPSRLMSPSDKVQGTGPEDTGWPGREGASSCKSLCQGLLWGWAGWVAPTRASPGIHLLQFRSLHLLWGGHEELSPGSAPCMWLAEQKARPLPQLPQDAWVVPWGRGA